MAGVWGLSTNNQVPAFKVINTAWWQLVLY